MVVYVTSLCLELDRIQFLSKLWINVWKFRDVDWVEDEKNAQNSEVGKLKP